jgi:hypothetical protein
MSDFRALLYTSENEIHIHYAALEQCFATSSSNFESTIGPQLPAIHDIIINIDTSSHKPALYSLPSIDILPYIRAHFTMPHIRFNFLTYNDAKDRALTDLAANIIHEHAQSWQKFVLHSGNVEKVTVWWKERSVDIVLKAGSSWAIDWDCGVEGGSAMGLKMTLGLVPKQKGEWKGSVVVASVE